MRSRTILLLVGVGAFLALLPVVTPARAAQDPQLPSAPAEVGILLGDSVVQGFGSSPVLYNERLDYFREDKYRFKPEFDKPIESLAGYQGIQLWLNRGVPGNPSQSILARWKRDIVEKQDRGAQTKNQQVKSILVSAGMTDIGAAVGTPNLLEAEADLRENLLSLVRLARSEGIRIAFLEPPDPTVAPMGRAFKNIDGVEVKPFCESHGYDEASCRDFEGAVQRTRTFMEKNLPRLGARVIDYAKILPVEYFYDAHHPTKAGYAELGKLLRERDAGR